MEFITDNLEEEYLHWLKSIGEDPYTENNSIGIHDVLRAHFLIADHFCELGKNLGGIGPRDLDLLHSALYRQHTQFEGVRKWKDGLLICSTLFFGLIKDHPFHDANKRTAFLVCLYHLQKLSRTPISKLSVFEKLTVDIAENRLDRYDRYKSFSKYPDPDVEFIADFLRRNTRKKDMTNYLVTYQQLDTLLRRFGFGLVNPHGNFIDVVKYEEKKKLLGRGSKQIELKMGTIGFPGWKRQAGKGAIHAARKATRLANSDGIDAAMFFKGADMLPSLIDMYEGPLKRLADK